MFSRFKDKHQPLWLVFIVEEFLQQQISATKRCSWVPICSCKIIFHISNPSRLQLFCKIGL